MRRFLLLTAVAAAAISSPAVARDQSQYVGIEAGLLFSAELEQDLRIDGRTGIFEYDDAFEIDFKKSFDVDAIVGYDYGLFRLEAEGGYKRLSVDRVDFNDALADDLGLIDSDFDLDGSGRVLSVMVNGLVDFGDDGLSFYAGGGVGGANVKFSGEKDTSFAWQLIAGVRKSVTPKIDIGLKYRYFRIPKLKFTDEIDDGQIVYGLDSRGSFHSHSLLASLIFNLVAAPLPAPSPPPMMPPPPPPPPATQTCPDGSVILATDMCPAAPVYVPPPPPPAPERG